MLTDEYPSNSINPRKEPAPVKKVVQGGVEVKKKGAISKFRDDLGLNDSRSVGKYIVLEVLIPAFKKLIHDMVNGGMDVWLYGEVRPSEGSRRSTASYRDYYDRRDDGRRREAVVRNVYDFNDIYFDNPRDADLVLEKMDDLIDQYRMAKVSDFYEFCGIQGDYTDNKYGWTDITSARVKRTRDGRYFIDMPRALPLN